MTLVDKVRKFYEGCTILQAKDQEILFTVNPFLGGRKVGKLDSFDLYKLEPSQLPYDAPSLIDFLGAGMRYASLPSNEVLNEAMLSLDRKLFFMDDELIFKPFIDIKLCKAQDQDVVVPSVSTDYLVASTALSHMHDAKISVIGALNSYLGCLLAEAGNDVTMFNLIPETEDIGRHNIWKAHLMKDSEWKRPEYVVMRRDNFRNIFNKYNKKFDVVISYLGILSGMKKTLKKLFVNRKTVKFGELGYTIEDAPNDGLLIAPFKVERTCNALPNSKKCSDYKKLGRCSNPLAHTMINYDYMISKDKGDTLKLLIPDENVTKFRLYPDDRRIS